MNDKITIIGAGMMGGAIIKSLLKGGYQGKITAVDIQIEKLKEFEELGVKISERTTFLLPACSWLSRFKIGSTNAAVLPVPVWAQPIMSLPATAAGIAFV